MAINLTDLQREIVRLLDEGLSVEEIAEELDRSPSTIRAHLHRLALRLGGGPGGRYVAHEEIPALVARRGMR